ncbi:MAG: hypothetical protein QM767_01670 [Anaeromyxobacter sp.]
MPAATTRAGEPGRTQLPAPARGTSVASQGLSMNWPSVPPSTATAPR